MIIKNNIINFSYLKNLKLIFNKFIYFLGFLKLIFIVLLLYYYFSSNLSSTIGFKETFLKFNRVFLYKYLGLDLTKIDDYLYIYLSKLNFLNKNFDIKDLKIIINQKSILQLESQRKNKLQGIPDEGNSTNAKIQVNNQDTFKIKIRIKGDRAMHWIDPKTTSYKIDTGKDNKIFGLKRFSLQKPITRNYVYELLFHKFLEKNDQLNLKYFLVNLTFNDEKRGFYVVEEGFSKELIERQKRRNGPIFSVDETFGTFYPNVSYQAYQNKYWVEQNPNLMKRAFAALNQIKDGEIELLDHFDEDKWASYFAIVDIMGVQHGSLSKSVRLYYNPLFAKFEPIGFDGHYEAGDFSNFILLDFLQEGKENINCSYICDEKKWYLKFFKLKNNNINYSFVKKYINYLVKYSNEEYLKNFLIENKIDIELFNYSVNQEDSKSDKVLYKGIAPYVYDKNFLFKRAALIKSRINSIRLDQYQVSLVNQKLKIRDNFSYFPIEATAAECENQQEKNFFFSGNMEINWPYNCKKIILKKNDKETKIFELKENFNIENNYQYINIRDFDLLSNNMSVHRLQKNEFDVVKDLTINKNTIINKDQVFKIKKGVKINILKNAILLVKGNILFNGSSDLPIDINSDKTGSIIFLKNVVKMNYVNVQNLGYTKLDGYIFYSGLNFINSELYINNVNIKNNNSEDAINLVQSNSYIQNLNFYNTISDALDVDFGSIKFENISCFKVGNDCLDVSGAQVEGKYLLVKGAKDKGISAGEASNVIIENIQIFDAKVGIGVKDGSIGKFFNIQLDKNIYDLALYNKKREYEKPEMFLTNIKFNEKSILQSLNTQLKINEKKLQGAHTDKYINSVLY